jgi:hypothetical protein
MNLQKEILTREKPTANNTYTISWLILLGQISEKEKLLASNKVMS